MTDLPTYSELRGIDVDVIYGLMVQHAEPVVPSTFEFARQRDAALTESIDHALREAAAGRAGDGATKPRWLDGLVQRELATASRTFWSRGSFARIRLLERIGLVALVPDDTYVLAMVSALGPHKAAAFRADPELVQNGLWRVFDIEGGGQVSLTNVDRFGGGEWRAAFLELTADGTLDRAGVLAACLTALSRDFAAYRAGWFSATFLALEPSTDEICRLQAELRRLLAAPVAATVAFALKHLTMLQKASAIDAEETLQALAPATSVKAKGTALAALRLTKSLAGVDEPATSTVATAALHHPHADVQQAAVEMLQESGHHQQIATVVDRMAPSIQRELGVGVTAVPDSALPNAQPRSDIPAAATRVDLAERTAALLEDASDVGEFESVLAALVSPGSEDVLSPLRRRARAAVARGARTDFGGTWLPGQVGRLVLGLLGEPAPPAAPDAPALRFLTRRSGELRDSSAPLLATPDLPGGWVSPKMLVDRLTADPHPRHHDLVAALLRLHPDGRATLSAPHLPAAVRFALDGADPRRESDPATARPHCGSRQSVPAGRTATANCRALMGTTGRTPGRRRGVNGVPGTHDSPSPPLGRHRCPTTGRRSSARASRTDTRPETSAPGCSGTG